MAFGSVSLIASSLGLNETRIGESNPVSKHNFLKGRGLVSAAVCGCSTNGEIPGSAIRRRACLVKEFREGRTCVLQSLFLRCLTEYQTRVLMFSAKP
jgi:hypothetical protein